MPVGTRKIFKHVIIYDNDKTKTLANYYFPTYEDIHAYIIKYYPQYSCPVSALQAIANNHVIDKYSHIYPFVKISCVDKKDIPKYHMIAAI